MVCINCYQQWTNLIRIDNWMECSVSCPFLSFKYSVKQKTGNLPIRPRQLSPISVFYVSYTFFIGPHCFGCQKKINFFFFFDTNAEGYIDEFEWIDDHRSGKVVVQLNGRLNKCGVISPRFNVKMGEVDKWADNLLPARQFGYVILTTSAGIMDHEEAKRKHVAGKILGFIYQFTHLRFVPTKRALYSNCTEQTKN